MKKLLLALPIAVMTATPAAATGGLVCRTAAGEPIEVALGFGHVAGSPLILARLNEGGRSIPVMDAQWWLDDREVRLVLIDPAAMREEVRLRARRNGHVYDGTLSRGGKRRWVRCREG